MFPGAFCFTLMYSNKQKGPLKLHKAISSLGVFYMFILGRAFLFVSLFGDTFILYICIAVFMLYLCLISRYVDIYVIHWPRRHFKR